MKVRLFEVFTSVEGEGLFYGTKTLFVRLAGCPFSCFYCDTAGALPADSGTEYDLAAACALVDESLAPNTFKVNFTGGDPLLQHRAVAEMARHVRESSGVPTYLESSCFDSGRFDHVLPFIDIAKIELKTRDSGFVDAGHHGRLMDNAAACLRSALSSGTRTYVKVVVSSRTTPADFAEVADRVLGGEPAPRAPPRPGAAGAAAAAAAPGGISGFVIQPTYGVAEPSLEQLMGFYDAAYGVAEPSLEQLMGFYDAAYPRYPDVRIVPQLHKFIGAP